jgi:hypothetical protein
MEIILSNNDKGLINKVSESVKKISEKARSFDRTNSQTTLAMTTLTMLNGQSPMRMLRQVTAEVNKRTSALYEAQYNIAKKKDELKELELEDINSDVKKAEIIKLKHEIISIEFAAQGSLKDIASLSDSYENIMTHNNIDDWDEETFEKEEKRHHIRRGFEMLFRNLIEYGRGKEATLEYLQQYGVHVQVAITEVSGYITVVNEMINKKECPNSGHLEDFLDTMRDKYEGHADISSKRIFGTDNIINKDYMLKLGEKNEDS